MLKTEGKSSIVVWGRGVMIPLVLREISIDIKNGALGNLRNSLESWSHCSHCYRKDVASTGGDSSKLTVHVNDKTLVWKYKWKKYPTRMHSSRMHTDRRLTVSWRIWGGGVSVFLAWGASASLVGEVCLPGRGGGESLSSEGRHPREQNDRHV